ncbi:MAG: hypothetical protein J7M39_15090, partial [Anaerolineae bacterium]|nr:hypothetical protein [Anaerolineae bacterium]
GWWWTDEDHEEFARWADREALGFFTALAHHLPYGETSYKKRPVPAGCRERAFINIGYGETRGIDVYGHYGPTIGPSRLEKTVAFLVQQQADGFLAYSEGLCDDVNKVLVAGLGAKSYETSDELLRAYAARYLGGVEAAWSAWLSRMGRVDTVDPVEARSRFDEITTSSRPSWRLRALAEKLNMRESDAAVRSETTWN